ncbi:MAG: RNA-binding cell elongation regulator Jag/EloR [Chloroflexota bacterium]
MVESVEGTGRTVDEAVENALDELRLEHDEVDVTVLADGRDGQLARVRVVPRDEVAADDYEEDEGPREDDADEESFDEEAPRARESTPEDDALADQMAEIAEDVLADILDRMDLPGDIDVDDAFVNDGLPTVELSVHGEFGGILIGRHGETLSSLQFLVQLIASRKAERRVRVILDVEGYRERRARLLRDMANRAADRAQRYRQPIFMDPMAPNERRIVHLTLQDHPGVSTHSVGEGDSRRVVVSPRQARRFGGYGSND